MSALDIPLTVTRFENKFARTATQITVTLRGLVEQIASITAPTKEQLPLYKMGIFDGQRTSRGSLRSNDTLREITGIEVEHDKRAVSLEEAEAAFHAAEIPALLYTTPSHRPDGPKWRAFIPTSGPLDSECREQLVSRVAGALPRSVELAPESWTRSQAYFLGHALDAAEFKALLVDHEDYLPIDLREDLDATALTKPRSTVSARSEPLRSAMHAVAAFDAGPGEGAAAFDDGSDVGFDPDLAREIILTGSTGQHDAMRDFAWALATHDLPERLIVQQLCDLYQLRAEALRDDRWHRDWRDIPRTVRSAIEKIAELRGENEAGSGNGMDHADPWAQRSTAAEAEEPDPLITPAQPQKPFPLERSPEHFKTAVAAVARVTEANLSLAATVTLSAQATAAARRAAGVEIEPGLMFPLSLYTADIVGSSERKTAAEQRVFDGIYAVERDELVTDYKLRLKQYYAEFAIYEKQKRDILSARKKSQKQTAVANAFDPGNALAALMGLHQPEMPLLPNIVTKDPTIEGARDTLAANLGQVSIVTSEGAVVLLGHSLGDRERRAASAAALSSFWDGHSITVMRAHGRIIQVNDPRVSISIGVQPRAAGTFFADRDLIDQGIVSRFLVTWPEPLAGTRELNPAQPDDLAAIRQFNDRAAACLRKAHGLDTGVDGTGGRLPEPAVMWSPLTLSDDARSAWWTFAREMERGQAKGAAFEHVRGWAGKAAEQAGRIAGVWTLFADPHAQEVALAVMQAAVEVVRWYADEWLRICDRSEPTPEEQRASQVLEWAVATYGGKTDAAGKPVTFTARDVYTRHVAGITTRAGADEALGVLARLGHIVTSDPPKPKRGGRPPLVKWAPARGVS